MKLILYFIAVFLFCSCVKKETVLPEYKYVFLSYGLPDFRNQHIRERVDEKWNIKRIAVAGCVVTNELKDSVEIENNKTDLALQHKYGKGWQAKYEKDFQDLLSKEVDVMDVLISNKSLRTNLDKCKIPIDEIERTIRPTTNSDVYTVDIFDYENPDKICFRMEVDIKKRTIKNINIKNHN